MTSVLTPIGTDEIRAATLRVARAEIHRLRAQNLHLLARVEEAEATMEQVMESESPLVVGRPDSPPPTAKGIEYAARRLHRVALRTLLRVHGWEEGTLPTWCALNPATREAWRAVAIMVWCQPQTGKTLQ